MFDEQGLWEVNKARHEELLSVAKTRRLLKQANVTKPKRKARFIVGVGDFLISLGCRLKAQYKPVAH